MYKLLKKSFLINKRNFIFGIAVSLLFASIQYDGIKYYPTALAMCPLTLLTFWIDKLCYVEDKTATRVFLLSLPISKYDLIKEKNIIAYSCIFLGMAIVHLVGIIIHLMLGIEVLYSIELILLFSMIVLVYSTIYIFLNYKYDYSKVKFAPFLMLIIMLLLFKNGNLINELSVGVSSLIVMLLFALLLNFSVMRYLGKS